MACIHALRRSFGREWRGRIFANQNVETMADLLPALPASSYFPATIFTLLNSAHTAAAYQRCDRTAIRGARFTGKVQEELGGKRASSKPGALFTQTAGFLSGARSRGPDGGGDTTGAPSLDAPKAELWFIGKYRLGDVLGTGGFGVVRKAVNMDTGQVVAIKCLFKPRLMRLSEDWKKEIVREIHAMMRINHPNVVSLLDISASKRWIYLVLEFMAGGTLYDAIVSAKKLEEDVARKYFQQLLDAVHYCHTKGVSHRDLKPENLLLDSKNQLKVADFGLAALGVADMFTEESGTYEPAVGRSIVGTQCYMAPEILTQARQNWPGYFGAPADVYSCGIILFCMLAGFPPINADCPRQKFIRRVESTDFNTYPYPPGFSAPVKELLAAMLNPKPKNRPTIQQLYGKPWVSVGYTPPDLRHIEYMDASLEKVEAAFRDSAVPAEENERTLNAFEFIAKAGGMDLTPLFGESRSQLGTRYTSPYAAVQTVQIFASSFRQLKYCKVQVKGYQLLITVEGAPRGGLGALSVLVDVLRVTPRLSVAELRKVSGDTAVFHEVISHLNRSMASHFPTVQEKKPG